MTKIKICGITNLEDAIVAADAGADYLGFIFYPPSPRNITEEEAKQVAIALKNRANPPCLVGVFVDETAEKMAAVLDECGLDLAQLSGNETPNLIGDPNSPIFGRSYKAIKPSTLPEAEAEAEWFVPPQMHPQQPSILVDTYHPTLHGGTGDIADWEMSASLAAAVPSLMLAGGLTPANVADAVRQVQPFAVDVASGVEASKGKKDHAAVRAFVEAIKTA